MMYGMGKFTFGNFTYSPKLDINAVEALQRGELIAIATETPEGAVFYHHAIVSDVNKDSRGTLRLTIISHCHDGVGENVVTGPELNQIHRITTHVKGSPPPPKPSTGLLGDTWSKFFGSGNNEKQNAIEDTNKDQSSSAVDPESNVQQHAIEDQSTSSVAPESAENINHADMSHANVYNAAMSMIQSKKFGSCEAFVLWCKTGVTSVCSTCQRLSSQKLWKVK